MTDPTGASYDRVADRYADTIGDELDSRPLERGLLDAFATLVGPAARVADIGCGPGHVTDYLARHGVAAYGVDLSEGMIDIARSRYPGSAFEVGTMLDLPAADESLAGALAWFSVIHLSDEERPRAYAEMARVVQPGGWLMLGFHVRDHTLGNRHAPGDVERMTSWWDQPVDLTFHYLDPDVEIASLVAAGWRPTARMEREPMIASEPQTSRCYLLLQRA